MSFQTTLDKYDNEEKLIPSYVSYEFPQTRYQGSKLKLVDWIWNETKDLNFSTVLDAFGGTGSVSYMYKQRGKSVTYNDILKFNYEIGKALIENKNVKLTKNDVDFLLKKHDFINYDTVIQDNFKDIYFTDCENQWLDMIIKNMYALKNPYKFAIAFFALTQSCIIKRPYNLFHRKNLYMRLSNVKRSFGNKTTWDAPFENYFLKFVNQANNSIFDNNQVNKSINKNAMEIDDINQYDLIYIDTPYISQKGSTVDYRSFYHFLEGLLNYDNWTKQIDFNSKHHRLKPVKNDWNNKKLIHKSFEQLIEKYQDKTLVISYRNDGIPSKDELIEIISEYKKKVVVKNYTNYKYVLSNKKTDELLFISV